MGENLQGSEKSDFLTERKLLEIAGELGLSETPAMSSIRQSLKPGDDENEFVEKMREYADSGIAEVEKSEDKSARSQIALNLLQATLLLKLCLTDDFYSEIEDGITFADNMGYQDLVQKLRHFLPEQ